MIPTTKEIFQMEFPGQNDIYYSVVANGLEELKQAGTIEADLPNGSVRSDQAAPWECAFDEIKAYYRELLNVWPRVELSRIRSELRSVPGFDQAIKVYQNSLFGVFLTNTKTLTTIYPELRGAWVSCYARWIDGNTAVIHPYSGLSLKKTRSAIRQIVNEVILHAERYHRSGKALKTLVKREYRLMLTEPWLPDKEVL